jgi:hypothetical protein
MGANRIAEANEKTDPEDRKNAIKWAKRRRVILLWSVGAAVAAASLVSGAGLLISALWLHESSRADIASWNWAYPSTTYLLGIEVALITVITVSTMGIAVWSAVKYGQKTEDLLAPIAFGPAKSDAVPPAI